MTRMTRFFWTLLPVCAMLSLVGLVHGQVTIVSNTGGATGNGGTAGSDNWFGQAFVVPSDTGYTLTSIVLKLDHDPINSGTYDVSVWSAAQNGQPGASLMTVSSGNNVADLTGSFANYTFNVPSPINLTAGSTYFVVLSGSDSSGSSGLEWGDSATFTSPSTGPGQIGGWTRSNDGGNSWDPVVASFPFEIGALGTPVPEPMGYAAGVGLVLLAFAGVRHLRRAAR